MRDASKLTDRHRARLAVVYVRQSTYAQVERNRESTDRQYNLAARAVEFGWASEAVVVIDDDLGVSGSGTAQRSGFGRLAAEVGLGHVGIVLSLEVSRLARSNAEWYRLLDLCALTATLIADADGIYDPADYSDRLVLGLKGTMSEAELHILRARLHGGLRNKAARRTSPAPGRCEKAAPCCKAWLSAAAAGGAWPCTTTAVTPPPDTTATAATWPRAEPSGACQSAAYRSIKPSARPS
jgi:DNA invertase Pin-like site-specific DNA recombinase